MTPKYLLKPARLAGSPLLATQSDERLVDLVRAGSEPAFDAIVSRYRGPLLRYCTPLLGRERAEDAVQQAFVNAYKAMHRNDSKLELKAWLYRIAHNVSLNTLRDRELRHEELSLDIPGAPAPEHELEQRERLAEVMAAVQALPERQREAIVLRELEGRSYDEIAMALGVGGGSVRALLNRARNSVRLAATAVTPTGLLLRIPAPEAGQAAEGVGARVAELTAGAGAGALASKVAATALVTGAVAGGVALAPGGDGGVPAGADSPPAAVVPGAGGGSGGGSSDDEDSAGEDDDRSGKSGDDDRSDEAAGDEGNQGRGRGGEDDNDSSGPGPGGKDNDEDNSGPGSGNDGEDNSGPGSGDQAPEEDNSGPGGGGSSGPGGGGSSGPGSGDAPEEDNSGPGSGEEIPEEDNSGPGSGEEEKPGDSSGPGSGSEEPDPEYEPDAP